jgi:hypothetical protein
MTPLDDLRPSATQRVLRRLNTPVVRVLLTALAALAVLALLGG